MLDFLGFGDLKTTLIAISIVALIIWIWLLVTNTEAAVKVLFVVGRIVGVLLTAIFRGISALFSAIYRMIKR